MTVERKTLVKRLDKLVSQIVRARDKRCVVCGSTERLTCGHLITRGKYSVRWDLMNCNCQCIGCNLKHEHYPEEYTIWFLHHYGEKAYEDLCHRADVPRKWSILELEELENELKNWEAE